MTPSDPEELRFDFVAPPEPVATADRAAADAPPASRPPRRVGAKEDHDDLNEDHALELKRRLASLRSTARRARSTHDGATKVPDNSSAEPSPKERIGSHESIDDTDAFEVRELDDALSIAGFYERVRFALSQEFSEEVWVVGEIRGFRESRGHRYLELADKGVEQVGRSVAEQLEVVCWARDWPPIGHMLAEAGTELEVGRVVRVRGKVSVWEGGSKLRFTLTALDVEALLGGIAAARRRLLAQLAEEDLLDANRRLLVALVPLRIGIITSPGSEAHRDFVGQLDRSGFAFDVHLEPSLVQGAEAPNQIAAAFERMRAFAPELVVLVRGGGARGDLAAFDVEEVARAIATAPFPVWTGIGHTSDRSVADEVAHRALITPTACGEAVVELVDEYWGQIVRQVETVSRIARARLDGAHHFVTASASSLHRAVHHQLDRRADAVRVKELHAARAVSTRVQIESTAISTRSDQLRSTIACAIVASELSLSNHRQVLGAFDPARQLARGWSLTHDESGRLVRSAEELSRGDRLRTRFSQGEAVSVVESLTNHADNAGQ